MDEIYNRSINYKWVKYSKDYSNYLTIKSEENNKYVILSIIDEGIGIVSKDLKRVFDPFLQEKMVVSLENLQVWVFI